MRNLITSDEAKCIGCNRCMRVCPIEGANIAYEKGNEIIVKVNNERCIACGECISACRHDARDYIDDTERFLKDLKNGASISMFAAPANRTNGEDGGRLLSWLRNMGVKKIYDVSLGADICTWAYIRYIQQNKPVSVITQPCPAIVNYVLVHNHKLLEYLSPVHSPMLCTAIYMKKYNNIYDSIAALSPCIAKSHEFEATGYVNYNVTLKKLYEYIKINDISLPEESSTFDHYPSAFGRLYPMPGGLKENVEFYLGKELRIDQSEGQEKVYKDLLEFSKEDEKNLPAIFDVLNCAEGCNIGTGCSHEYNKFITNTIMDKGRKEVLGKRDRNYYDQLFNEYDASFNLQDFIRTYRAINIPEYKAEDDQIEKALIEMGKISSSQRMFDCSACGSDSCYDMARKIAIGVNVPSNCIQKNRDDIRTEHENALSVQSENIENIKRILNDITVIKSLSEDIVGSISNVNEAIEQYNIMSKEVDAIASYIHLISFNASIEAARAGVHGKAFAVVAEEIRNLANNSKNTVSQTELISDQAKNSSVTINGKIMDISNAIAAAYEAISAIYNNTKAIVDANRHKN